MQFNIEGYKGLIEVLQKNNYQCIRYIDIPTTNKHYILRHDIDMELRYALELAKVEKELGVRATYFVLINSNFYNIHSKESRNLVKKIMEYGHCIGLHFDEVNYEQRGMDAIAEHIQEECTILSNVIEKEVKIVSMHRPSTQIIDSDLKIKDMINTYGQKYFKEYKYISDSRRSWREDPIETIQSGKYDKFQIVTHPIWYISFKDNIKEVVKEMLKQKDLQNYQELKNNFRNLEQELSEQEILAKYEIVK